jgi:L-threonylcarbamoyladenylate synthase
MNSAHEHKRLSAKDAYLQAIDILRRGGVVALPTDTVYGLVAVAADAAAVDRIYEIKQRDPAQPMPLFVSSVEQASLIAELSPAARALAGAFWPGALTVVARKRPRYGSRALAGQDTIGLRVPDDPALREMAAQLGPLTGTSANIAGREDCTTAAAVGAQLGGTVDMIVDAPVRAIGIPSTIVDCSGDTLAVLRAGGIERERIEEALAGIAELR